MNNLIKYFLKTSYLSSYNRLYIDQLYNKFLINPNSIDYSWHLIFNNLNLNLNLNKNNLNYLEKFSINYFKIFKLINDFRCYGYQNANLDPLNLNKFNKNFDLSLNNFGFLENDLNKITNFDFIPFYFKKFNLLKLFKTLNNIYCNNIGIEFMHIKNIKEKNWIQYRIESYYNKFFDFNFDERIKFLNDLIYAENLENYLGIKFPGTKRFSLEGCDVLIPMLNEIIRYSCNSNVKEIVLGMSHRGRLNVLVNVFGKKLIDLYNEFNGNLDLKKKNSGDVKYHQGFSSDFKILGNLIRLNLAFNPSHLEIISPVIMGLSRSKIDTFLCKNYNYLLPITLHGDASISGQGVVQETLNMSKVPCYNVGGTLRIVINNQIGFTTSNNCDLRSGFYSTDIAKMLDIPVFHVNADDVESVIFITRVALDYRNMFNKDVFIDLVCYRRHGHNEVDDPFVTQPLMYNKIKNHSSVCKIYFNYLLKNNLVNSDYLIKNINLFRNILKKGDDFIKNLYRINIFFNNLNIKLNYYDFYYVNNINKIRIKKIFNIINKIPLNFSVHKQIEKIFLKRKLIFNSGNSFDWGLAEILAYATLLDSGISVRLSGEDTIRGTFFHRHAIIFDQINENSYIPLSNIHNSQGIFHIYNSVLSEESVLAFEYGYSLANPNMLVIWEAQFGDFANCAQVVIDQFISSSEQKWCQMCGIVILLPHGYEGQGPEHSSARIERYLQLCAQYNIQVCIPSTPVQMYHLLRRQVILNICHPLIIMTPKSLLRHPLAVSSLNEFIYGKFEPVLFDNNFCDFDVNKIKRIIFCSGKIYYDLFEKRKILNINNIIIIRIEQFYPFPLLKLKNFLLNYNKVNDYIWCQEEPKNQGAWFWINPIISNILPNFSKFVYIGRPSSAAPSVGYFSLHKYQQDKIINKCFFFKK